MKGCQLITGGRLLCCVPVPVSVVSLTVRSHKWRCFTAFPSHGLSISRVVLGQGSNWLGNLQVFLEDRPTMCKTNKSKPLKSSKELEIEPDAC